MVEFAICMPVFFLLAMSTIETCRMMYLRQSLKIAGYECARIGITPGMSAEVMQNQCDAIMTGRQIRNYQMLFQPTDLEGLQFGDLLTITVNASAADNALVGAWFYRQKTLSESVTIMAEK